MDIDVKEENQCRARNLKVTSFGGSGQPARGARNLKETSFGGGWSFDWNWTPSREQASREQPSLESARVASKWCKESSSKIKCHQNRQLNFRSCSNFSSSNSRSQQSLQNQQQVQEHPGARAAARAAGTSEAASGAATPVPAVTPSPSSHSRMQQPVQEQPATPESSPSSHSRMSSSISPGCPGAGAATPWTAWWNREEL